MWLVVDNQMIGKDVWFDNVSILHYNSIVLEEDHYYPFGLTMNINAAQVEAQKNPYKYQGIELEQHFGLEQYETLNRLLDPQLGIFRQIDPKAELDYSLSPFVSMRNNPAYYADPLGDVAGDFLDRNGKNIGSDGKEDGKLYVLNTNEKAFPDGNGNKTIPGANSQLSNKDAAKMVASGNIDYNEFTEIPGSEDTRQAMMNEANKDKTDNSTEHGGVVTANGDIIPTTPDGDHKIQYNNALNPQQQGNLDVSLSGNGYVVFHSHTSAQQNYDYYAFDQGQRVVKTEQNNVQVQSPSKADISNIKGGVQYGVQFGMGKSTNTQGYPQTGGGQKVYIFNSQGVRATLPLNKFVNQ